MGLAKDIFDSFFGNLFSFLSGLGKRQKPDQAFVDGAEIREIAHALCEGKYLSIDCFFLLKAHHNGKKTKSEFFKYRSLMGGYHKDWVMPNFNPLEYKYVKTDAEYRWLMDSIVKNEEFGIVINTMQDTKLANAFKFQNLKYVKYFLIKDNGDKALWYVLVGTIQSEERFDSIDHKFNLQMAINRIRNIIDKY